MFGLIYTMVMSVGSLFHTMRNNMENEENKTRFRQPDGLTYLDIKGQTRFLSNNALAFYTYATNGDYILKDIHG